MSVLSVKMTGTQLLRKVADTPKKLMGYSNQLPHTMQEFGRYHLAETNRTFIQGGRGEIKWAPLKNRSGRRVTSKPLNKTGGMRRANRSEVVTTRSGVEQRTINKHPLARIHHGGARIPPRKITAVNARALRFVINGRVVFAASAELPEVKIPARPILFYTDKDRRHALTIIRRDMMTQARKVTR